MINLQIQEIFTILPMALVASVPSRLLLYGLTPQNQKYLIAQILVVSILLVLISIIYLLYKFNSVPLVGISVGLAWSIYNLLRKTINVATDIGLLVESLFILPFAIIVFYFIVRNNFNDFSFSNPSLMFLLILAGPMTIIPLFFHIKGVELAGLGPSGMIFYIVPTLHFILGYFYYNEPFSSDKFISFILIWIAVFIYLKDLYENN